MYLHRFTSIGMRVEDHLVYSASLAEHFYSNLNICKSRVVIEFHSPEPTNMGKLGSTVAELRKLQQ